MNKQLLIESGIEYDSGVEKFLDEAELYESLLRDFLTDNTFDEAKRCVQADDYDGVLRTIHAMKSVTGTLCMNTLYRKCCETVDSLRAKRYDDMKKSFGEAYSLYERIAEAVKNA